MTNQRLKNPLEQVENQNPWYTDDQFKLQLQNPAVKRIIFGRWEIFKSVIHDFAQNSNFDEPLQILDAGCGDGINLVGLQDILSSCPSISSYDIHACDYNEVRLERANKFTFVKTLKQIDLTQAAYESNSFDIIICNHVLEHIPDITQAIAELGRILKPGGKLILNIPNEGCIMARLRNHVLQRKILKTTDHVHFLTKKSFSKIIRTTGLNIQKWERRGFFMPYMPLLAYLRQKAWGEKIELFLEKNFPSQGTDLLAVVTKN